MNQSTKELELDSLINRFEKDARKSNTSDGVKLIFDDYHMRSKRLGKSAATEFVQRTAETLKKSQSLPISKHRKEDDESI